MIRRLLTFLVVAAATAGGTTWWLYDGDLAAAVEPLTSASWDADALAVEAGVVTLGLPAPAPGATPISPGELRPSSPAEAEPAPLDP